MTEFNAVLRRAFAEAPEPVDDGFTVKVGHAVARREAATKARSAVYAVGMGVAGLAVLYAAYSLATAFGQEFLANAGLEVARAHGALSGAPPVSGVAQSFMQSLGAGLTQALIAFMAVVGGGALAYRVSQD